MRITEACRVTGISRRNIHFYIKEGLVAPAVCPTNRYYDFSDADCQKLLFIREMRNAGLSLPAIRSMIKNPFTASVYLNRHIQRLKRRQRQLEQTLTSMQFIQSSLPLYPDFPMLCSICREAGIPLPADEEDRKEEMDSYDTAVVNHFLWGSFLPETEFTEYQQFLWMKLGRVMLERPTREYRRLARFLDSLSPAQIERIFMKHSDRHAYIAALTEEEYAECVRGTITLLESCLQNPAYVRFWNKYYRDFFQPTVTVQASERSALVMELSPFYKNYVEHAVKTCELTYQYLCSEDGSGLYQRMRDAFGDNLDLEHANHGELESLVSLPEFSSIMSAKP